MLRHIKDSTFYTLGLVLAGLNFLFAGCIALWEWSTGFAQIDSIYGYVVPKIAIMLAAYYLTPIPFFFAVVVAFLPWQIAATIVSLAFFIQFLHF